ALRPEDALVAEVHEGVEVLVGQQPDVAALAAVAAVRAAEGDELLAPETDAAVPAVAGDDGDFGFVDEFHKGGNGEWGMGTRLGRSLDATGLAGMGRGEDAVASGDPASAPYSLFPIPCSRNEK